MSNEHDELEAAAINALGEVLNLAAQIAEMQMDEQARADIYELLDTVADHYGVERTEIRIDDDDNDTVIIRYTQEIDDDEESDEGTKDKLPSYITLAVDNSDKKIH